MDITVVGATGMIGSRVVAEAAARGHNVTAAGRSGAPVDGAADTSMVELSDTATLVSAIEHADVTVLTVPPDRTGGSHEPTLAAHRDLIAAKPSGRVLVVGGAGALSVDGVELRNTAEFPPEYKPEADTFAEVLALYRGSEGLDWSMLAPAPVIAPGERTGEYVTGVDSPAGPSISAEDFAVALVDELETPQNSGRRFTVAAG